MTHARRYVVSSQSLLTIVSCRVASSVGYGETKRDPARISEIAEVGADASLPCV